MRRTWRASNRIQSALYELEALVGKKNGVAGTPLGGGVIPEAKKGGKRSFHLPSFNVGSKALAIALVEAVLLIIIYGGLLREYGSKVNMQNWVQGNFASRSYLLNYNADIVFAGPLVI